MSTTLSHNATSLALIRALRATYPQPQDIDSQEFRRNAQLSPSPDSDQEDFGTIVRRLSADGLIRYRQEAGWGHIFTHVELTPLTTERLKRIPDLLNPRRTVGQWLDELTPGTDSEIVTQIADTIGLVT